MPTQNQMTPLHKAALQNKCEYLQDETISSANLLTTFAGNTPLLWGVANSSINFVLELLNSSDTTHVNMKSTSYLKNTPLILSVSKGGTHIRTNQSDGKSQMAIAKKLLENGAETNAVDADGRTALHYACLHRNMEAIVALVTAGSHWETKDKSNHSPLDFCCLDVITASKILSRATGGEKNDTFTLVESHFDSNNDFYQLLSHFLTSKGARVDISVLQQAHEYNKKLYATLSPIYHHAKKIFIQHRKDPQASNSVWQLFSKEEGVHLLNNELIEVGIVTESFAEYREERLLLKLHTSLQSAALAQINMLHNQITANNQELVQEIMNKALENPELKAQRKMIARVGIVILNVVSILCAGLPLFVNHHLTGQFFFTHTTRTLLHNTKYELSRCASML